MRRIRLFLLAFTVALGSILWSAGPVSAAADDEVYYLALGDSLAFGVQPNGDFTQGYPQQLLPLLTAKYPSLKLANLGCPGETTGSMLNDSVCDRDYPKPDLQSQVEKATQFISRHKVAYLTIDIGANDVLRCVDEKSGVVDAQCFDGRVGDVRKNLDAILDKLRDSIRDSAVNKRFTKTAGMTYYNPTLAYWFTNPAAANASVGYQTQLNLTEAAQYVQHGFRVAPVAYAFQTYDFRIPTGSSIPANVQFICGNTWACTGDIHATTRGYGVIADTFAQTFRW